MAQDMPDNGSMCESDATLIEERVESLPPPVETFAVFAVYALMVLGGVVLGSWLAIKIVPVLYDAGMKPSAVVDQWQHYKQIAEGWEGAIKNAR